MKGVGKMHHATYDVSPRKLWFNIEAVGCDEYLRSAQRASASRTADENGSYEFPVELVLEPDNPFHRSRQAISIRFEDEVLGYLPEDESEKYWDELARIAATGLRPTTMARLIPDGDLYSIFAEFTLIIALGVPGTLVPVNDPPVLPMALLPWGEPIPVLIDNNQINVLQPLISESGENQVLVTLHSKNSAAEGQAAISVHVGFDEVGELPQSQVFRLLPLIEQVEKLNLQPTARAMLRGSAVAAAMTVCAARADEVAPSFLYAPESVDIPKLVNGNQLLAIPDAWTGENNSDPFEVDNFDDEDASEEPSYEATANNPYSAAMMSAQKMLETRPTLSSALKPSPKASKDIGVAYFLWLFLGIFGAHRIYLGDNVGGLLQLITMGGAGSWWLLDIFLIPGMVNRCNANAHPQRFS